MLATLLTLIFIRPFISSLAFPYLNLIYSTLLLSFLVAWLIAKRVSLKHFPQIKLPLILFILALLISLCFSQDPLLSLGELYKYATGFLIFLCVFSLAFKDKKKILLCLVWSGLLVSAFAIYQYFFGFRHLSDYILRQQISDPFILDYLGRKRVFSPFVTPTVLGGYLAMIIPLALSQRNKVYLIIPLAIALLLTKSISALLSIFAGILFYFYWDGRLERKKIIAIGGIWVIAALVLMTRLSTTKEHLQPLFSALMRLNYWGDTLGIIKAAPLTGAGLGNFNLAYSRYAHNAYLQIWAEMGILGICAFFWLIIKAYKLAYQDIRNLADKQTPLIGLMAASAVFLIHNFVEFTFFLPEVTTLWWVILGLMLSRDKEP